MFGRNFHENNALVLYRRRVRRKIIIVSNENPPFGYSESEDFAIG